MVTELIKSYIITRTYSPSSYAGLAASGEHKNGCTWKSRQKLEISNPCSYTNTNLCGGGYHTCILVLRL